MIEAVVSLGAKAYKYDLGALSAFIEWSLFITTFYIFAVLAHLMPYKLKVSKME